VCQSLQAVPGKMKIKIEDSSEEGAAEDLAKEVQQLDPD